MSKEGISGSWMATAVPQKGGEGRFAADKFLEHIADNGDKVGNVIVKGDQENSMSYLLDQIVDLREEGKTILEESPMQSKWNLGIAERAVQEIESGLRGMFLAL